MSIDYVTTHLEDPRSPMRYELSIRNKFIGACAQATTLEEMATALRAQANLFEALNDPRIKYDTDGWEDDYHHFYTDDETIAEKFGFNEITDEDLLAELSDRNDRRRRASLVLASYMEARARHEGVSYGLDAAFFDKALATGIQSFFGVQVDEDNAVILRDDQNPEFLARYREGDA